MYPREENHARRVGALYTAICPLRETKQITKNGDSDGSDNNEHVAFHRSVSFLAERQTLDTAVDGVVLRQARTVTATEVVSIAWLSSFLFKK
jgi:hypothetical protein